MFSFLENSLRNILRVENFNHVSRRCLYFILLMNVVASMMVTVFIPGFSLAANDLNTTQSMMQLTVVAHLVGEIAGRLLCGPLSDYVGNKRGIIPAMTISIVGQLGCMLSQSVEMLIIARFVQAIGSGVIYVISLNFINENFSGIAKCRAMSTLEMYQPIANLTAPILGGFICYFAGWRSIFAFLLILQIIMRVVVGAFMPDETRVEKQKASITAIIYDYKTLIFNKIFLVYSIIPGFVVGGYLIFSSHAPEICEHLGNYSEFNVVLLQSLPLVFNIISTSLYRYTIREFGIKYARRSGALAMAVFVLILSLMIFKILPTNMLSILFAMCIQCFGSAFIVPVSVLGAMENSNAKSGSSAAAIVVFRNTIMSLCVSYAAVNEGLLSSLSEILLTAVIVLGLLFVRRKIKITIRTTHSEKNTR